MKSESEGETLNVSEIDELSAANSDLFRHEVATAFGDVQRNIDVDLSQTLFLDSCGLGALISLYKITCKRNGKFRVVNPRPPVCQILELTRMHRLFEVVRGSREQDLGSGTFS